MSKIFMVRAEDGGAPSNHIEAHCPRKGKGERLDQSRVSTANSALQYGAGALCRAIGQ